MILRFLILFVCAAAFAAWRLDSFDLPEMTALPAPAPATAGPSAAVTLAAPGPVPPPDAFSQIVDRPLFRPDRRPPDPAPVTAPAPPPPPAPEPTVEWTLIGVGQNESGRVAILRIDGTAEPLRARVGDQLAGRIVKEISAGDITLEDIESREIFKLVLPRD